MKTYQIPKRDLWAISLLAPANDIRYYLNGVLFEVGPKEGRLVATDGKSIGVMRLPDVQNEVAASYIIPLKVVAGFPWKKGGSEVLELAMIDDDNAELRDPMSGWSRKFKFVFGKYPDYRRVFEQMKEPNNVPAQINTAFLAKFSAVAKRMGSREGYLHVTHNEESVMIAAGNDRFVGIIMGIRTNSMPGREYPGKYESTPSWIADQLK